MIGLIVSAAITVVRNTLGKALRVGAIGLVLGIVFIEVLAALLNKAAGSHGFVTFHVWPPELNTDVFTQFVHISAVLFGLVLAIALILWVVVGETIRGLLFAANHVDNAALGVIQQTIGKAGTIVGAVGAPVSDTLDNRGQERIPPA